MTRVKAENNVEWLLTVMYGPNCHGIDVICGKSWVSCLVCVVLLGVLEVNVSRFPNEKFHRGIVTKNMRDFDSFIRELGLKHHPLVFYLVKI